MPQPISQDVDASAAARRAASGERRTLVTLSLWLAACGSDAAPAATDSVDAQEVEEDVVSGCPLPGSSAQEGAKVQSEDLHFNVGGAKIKASIAVPTTCQNASPCPLVVVVGDRDTSPVPQWIPHSEALAESSGTAVLVFNLPGTGIGGHASTGSNDYGGEAHLAAVKEVMRLTAEKPYIDKKRSGFLTVGWGLLPVAAAMSKFTLSSLNFVHFLIDVEGPSDRCAATQAPADPARSIGPDDGPGATESACNFGAIGSHSAAYPPASGDKPASILCAPGAWPITETGKDCTDNTWWIPREPARALAATAVQVRYQRVQLLHSRAPSHHAARVMIKQLAASKSRFFALNDMPPCQPSLDDATCDALLAQCQRCWLEGTFGNGMSPAPYASGALAEVTIGELFADVLPRFVRRMVNPAESPNCR